MNTFEMFLQDKFLEEVCCDLKHDDFPDEMFEEWLEEKGMWEIVKMADEYASVIIGKCPECGEQLSISFNGKLECINNCVR